MGTLVENRHTLHRFACGFADSQRLTIYLRPVNTLCWHLNTLLARNARRDSSQLFLELSAAGERERRGERQGGNNWHKHFRKCWWNSAARATSLTAQGHLLQIPWAEVFIGNEKDMWKSGLSWDCGKECGSRVTDMARMATDVYLTIGLAAAESTKHWQS